jgi:hypothetical protein
MAGSARIRIETSYSGIGKIARGSEVSGDMLRRARKVAAAARSAAPEMQEGEITVEAELRPGRERARAVAVARHPGVAHAEAKHRFLGRAVDAAG